METEVRQEARQNYQSIEITTKGNITTCHHVPSIGAAFTIIRNIIQGRRPEQRDTSQPLSNTIIIDFDGPLAVSLAEQICVGYTPSSIDSLRQYLKRYPNESVIILTNRHFEYGWGKRIQWICELVECLSIGDHYSHHEIPMHSLAYDSPKQLANILSSNKPKRAIIAGAAKDTATRLLEAALGHRKFSTFLVQDILKAGDKYGRLLPALEAIFATQDENSFITIIDDGPMWEATKLIASNTEAHIIYISIENFRIGNIPRLVFGAMGALAYALRNISYRSTLTRTIYDP